MTPAGLSALSRSQLSKLLRDSPPIVTPRQAAAALDLSSLILPPMSLGGGRDEDWKRMGSLLDAIFAPPPSSSYHAGDSGDADPFERMFEEMMNWSLSAFDQASSSSSSSALTAAAAEEERKAASTDTRAEEDASSSSSALTAAADDDWDSIAPEVAAENALDVAVAELARRSIHRAGSEDGAAVPAVAAPRAWVAVFSALKAPSTPPSTPACARSA